MDIHRKIEVVRIDIAEAMMEPLKKCGVILTDDEFWKLRDKLIAFLIGELRI